MRVNVYAEEMTERLEIIGKEIDGHRFTGLRFYLELPATVDGKQYQGPFMHRPGDDDSSAVTFWGKRDLRKMLRSALELLDAHYGDTPSRYVQGEDADVATILRGFDEGVFIRNTAKDLEPGWAVKLLPYLAALGRLYKRVGISGRR